MTRPKSTASVKQFLRDKASDPAYQRSFTFAVLPSLFLGGLKFTIFRVGLKFSIQKTLILTACTVATSMFSGMYSYHYLMEKHRKQSLRKHMTIGGSLELGVMYFLITMPLSLITIGLNFSSSVIQHKITGTQLPPKFSEKLPLMTVLHLSTLVFVLPCSLVISAIFHPIMKSILVAGFKDIQAEEEAEKNKIKRKLKMEELEKNKKKEEKEEPKVDEKN